MSLLKHYLYSLLILSLLLPQPVLALPSGDSGNRADGIMRLETRPVLLSQKSEQKIWFIVESGKREGPVSIEGVRKMLSTGQASLKSYVWKKGMAGWKPITEVEDFKEIVENQRRLQELADEAEKKSSKQTGTLKLGGMTKESAAQAGKSEPQKKETLLIPPKKREGEVKVFVSSSEQEREHAVFSDQKEEEKPKQEKVAATAAPQPAAAEIDEYEYGKKGPGPWPWVVVGVGGAMLITGGVFWYLGYSTAKDDQVVNNVHSTTAAEAQSANRNGMMGIVMTGVGVAALAGGLTWYLVDKPRKPTTSGPEWSLAPIFDSAGETAGAAFSVNGRF